MPDPHRVRRWLETLAHSPSQPTTVRRSPIAGRSVGSDKLPSVDNGKTGRLHNLRLFLASPGGLEKERKAVHRLIDEMNVSLRRIDWQVEVLGWERMGPAGGRAQAEINQDADRADVFCGLLWDRWGTPTGEHASGFEEEWQRSRDRFERTKSPELWLFFKAVAAGQLSDPGPQLRSVIDFRESVEREEIAFYKTFTSSLDLESELRRALWDLVISRAGVGTTPSPPDLDWEAALRRDPISLLQEGQERERLAEESAADEPARAAEIFLLLASELEELGFDSVADRYRRRAASALSAAGRTAEAADLWRGVLRRALSTTHPVEVDFAARQLGKDLPPEDRWEERAWRACATWPDDPESAREDLREAIRRGGATSVDAASLTVWRETLWSLDLSASSPDAVLAEAGEAPTPLDPELELLTIEARAQLEPKQFRALWAEIRERILDESERDPATAARMCARWACELARRGETDEAQEAFARAAAIWGRLGDGEEEAAECFFSALSAAGLAGEIVPAGWGWRPVAASIRGGATSAAARAGRLEHAGLAEGLREEPHEARRQLRLAISLRRRAGHLRGWLGANRALGDCERTMGNTTEAALAYCECSDPHRAAAAAGEGPTRQLCDRLPIGGSHWSTRASIAVLAKIGRWASTERAAAILPELMERTAPNAEQPAGDRYEAVEALGQISFSLSSKLFDQTTARLIELLPDENRLAAEAAGDILRLLGECGRLDASQALVGAFAAEPTHSGVNPYWVAERLGSPGSAVAVRDAAIAGKALAMQAMVEAGLVIGDAELQQACDDYCASIISGDLGRDKSGAVHGFLALDLIGSIAVAVSTEELRVEVAEKLLLYALEDVWPVVNRAAAVRGFAALAETLDPITSGERLRPLLELDDDAYTTAIERGAEWFSSAGELEGAVLCAASKLFADNPPDWLSAAVADARLDPRRAMRVAAWQSISSSSGLSDTGLELALLDPRPGVRVAALYCWMRRRRDLPPDTSLEVLCKDAYTEVRVAVIRLLADHDQQIAPQSVITALQQDVDSWVAHLTRHELGDD